MGFIFIAVNAYNVIRISAPTNMAEKPSNRFPPKKIANAPAVIA